MMGLTKCQECWMLCWTLKEQKEFEEDAFNQSTRSGKRFSENVLLINWIIKLVTVDQTGFFFVSNETAKDNFWLIVCFDPSAFNIRSLSCLKQTKIELIKTDSSFNLQMKVLYHTKVFEMEIWSKSHWVHLGCSRFPPKWYVLFFKLKLKPL